MFKDLSPIWQETFAEAWTAFCEGTIPIGAIITDKDGNVLSRGRNSIYNSQVLNPKMQHAEMNCLANLDTHKYPDVREYFLYTTMEPCPMCMGTLTMSNIRHVRYAARDDFGGAAHIAFNDRYVSKKKIDIEYANNGMEAVMLTMQVCFDFRRRNAVVSNGVLEVFKNRRPEAFTAAVNLFTRGDIERFISDQTPMCDAYDLIEAECDRIREKNAKMLFTARIEQTNDYPNRMKYIPETDSFVEKEYRSLSYDRNVPEPYGWIVESGTPPYRHLDVIVMSDKKYALGDCESVRVVGVFCRNDGDNKLVAVPTWRNIFNFSELTETEKEDLHRLYPHEDPGEGWFGADKAKDIIDSYYSCSKPKNIYLIQHCESEHHVNGMIGAWTNWNLTERGHEQARITGEWLLEHEFKEYRGCRVPFTQIFCSTLNRAMQTADEILKSVDAPIVYRDTIREVSAGAAHGHSREWNIANQAPHPDHYDPDYRPFPDADSDRDLWNRVKTFYQEIIHSDYENIIVVSHGCTLSYLQCMLMGHTDVDCRAYFAPSGPAGSISKFSIDTTGRVRLSYLNRLAE